ncbi:dTMP kinase [Actinomadura craniellae]|uniref:Thymidylate kinase n=1 Tax=Actinomadura craniellae TaxID=2231787 RepID=A0A365H376_9ACTN|nr:dTMP kinase [Actinomadura craniellae]RAY13478.1 dTMP kinase [Actinomadura craniellae]
MSGVFLVIEGPNGVGKSTAAVLLAKQFRDRRIRVHLTTEPSATPLGRMIRASESQLSGRALALAIAADRCAHVEREIIPALNSGKVVISDRFVQSSLVLQRLDRMELPEIWQYNRFVPSPDLSFYLEDDPNTITARLKERQRLSRLERTGSPTTELDLYEEAYRFLGRRRWRQAKIDCRGLAPDEVVSAMINRIELLGLLANVR